MWEAFLNAWGQSDPHIRKGLLKVSNYSFPKISKLISVVPHHDQDRILQISLLYDSIQEVRIQHVQEANPVDIIVRNGSGPGYCEIRGSSYCRSIQCTLQVIHYHLIVVQVS
jgi:hypothetical protein